MNEEIRCECSKKHVPLPLTYHEVGAGGRVYWLCPTSHENLRDLLTAYVACGSVPDGSVTKHYGKFVRDLAQKMWVDRRGLVML